MKLFVGATLTAAAIVGMLAFQPFFATAAPSAEQGPSMLFEKGLQVDLDYKQVQSANLLELTPDTAVLKVEFLKGSLHEAGEYTITFQRADCDYNYDYPPVLEYQKGEISMVDGCHGYLPHDIYDILVPLQLQDGMVVQVPADVTIARVIITDHSVYFTIRDPETYDGGHYRINR